MLSVAARRYLDEISDLHVHKGKDPVVEIAFGGSKVEKVIF